VGKSRDISRTCSTPEEMTHVQKILVRKSQKNGLLGRHKGIWESNIKLNHKVMMYMRCFWHGMVLILPVTNILVRYATTYCSRMTLHHEGNKLYKVPSLPALK
jgi:hypothetical protein